MEREASGDDQSAEVSAQHRGFVALHVAFADSPKRGDDAPQSDGDEDVDPSEVAWMKTLDEDRGKKP